MREWIKERDPMQSNKNIDPAQLSEWLLPLGLWIALIIYCLRGIVPSYSYWSDEMWSVGAVMESWRNMFALWIIPDSAPPLYQTLLKLWTKCFGTNEIATRSLSIVFAAFGLGCFAWGSRLINKKSLGNRLLATTFIGLSPAFSYYGQTTRNYSLLLAASCLFITTALVRRSAHENDPNNDVREKSSDLPRLLDWAYYFSGLALSLTHYFGLVFAFSVVMADELDRLRVQRSEYRPQRAFIIAGITAVLWPTFQILFANGNPSEYISSSAANIDVIPIWGTAQALLSGCLPIIGIYGILILFILSFAWIAINSSRRGYAIKWIEQSFFSTHKNELQWIFARTLSFVMIISLVDIVKPISMGRNFIVCLPYLLTHLEILHGLQKVRKRSPGLVLCVVILVALSLNSNSRLARKQTPLQNPRALGEFAIETRLCNDGCISSSTQKRSQIYLPGIVLFDAPPPEKPMPLSKPLIEWEGGSHSKEYYSAALETNPSLICWEGKQAQKRSTFILMDKNVSDRLDPASHGLIRCKP